MGARLSEDEIQRALDFCVHLFDPTTPEQHEFVRRRLLDSQWNPSELDEHDEDDTEGAHDHTQPSTFESQRGLAERLLDVRAPIEHDRALGRVDEALDPLRVHPRHDPRERLRVFGAFRVEGLVPAALHRERPMAVEGRKGEGGGLRFLERGDERVLEVLRHQDVLRREADLCVVVRV